MQCIRKAANKWNALDKCIAKVRYSRVRKFINSGDCVLDMGCGQECNFLMYLQNKIKMGYGVDPKANSERKGNIEIIGSKINETSFCSKSFDKITFLAVLEHLEQPKDVLEEAFRLVKDDGYIILTTPTIYAKPILEFMAFKLHIINEDEIKEHKKYYTKNDIVSLVREINSNKTGYQVVVYRYFEFFMNSLIVIKNSKII